jgi:tRNA (mo5U34)-methyltransferase
LETDEIMEKINHIPFWYHKIDLGNGIVTPGLDFDNIWNNIRKTRSLVDYTNKNVLDIGSFDGMWAFEAEKLGANIVIATDVYYQAFKKFLLCKEILESKVIPYYNVTPYELYNRLEVFLKENIRGEQPEERKIDIIQHFGVFYHLRDPLYSLSQARSIISSNGCLILETAAILDEERSFMAFNSYHLGKGKIYNDCTTWWAPTFLCLKEMLRTSLFEVDDNSVNIINQSCNEDFQIGRIALIARPLSITTDKLDQELVEELKRIYRNPGFVVENI